jgi:UDP-2-acetamido-2-deoxy-ribo-hexuluronate aminotransferase
MVIEFPIQMYDPKREYLNNKENINKSIQSVLDHGIFINGPETTQLEKKLKEYVNTDYCITVSNGTDALKIALLALGVGIDDEVITVAHTWISSAECISIINARPVFVDIENETFNLDPNKIEEKITLRTKAIIVVSLYGQIPDLDRINEIGKKYNIPVIEDGAQSFGAVRNNKKSCSMTTIGTTSFFPSKPLGCYGDGGACFTNDPELAVKIRAIKSHGGIERFKHEYIGLNGRLDTLQASILLEKFKYFDITLEKRNKCAFYYSEKLKELDEKKLLKTPIVKENNISAWAQYSILVPTKKIRDDIVDYLKKNKINVAIFYPAPLHTQKCFSYLECKKGELPITENVCDTIFNLPCYAEITIEEQDYIIDLLYKFFTSFESQTFF